MPKPKQKPKNTKASHPTTALRGDFNFIENLLAFCTHKSRKVPAEDGIHFQIDPAIQKKGLCLLFHIDREGKDTLIAKGPRPDYLVFFASPTECICTIIEMKGREEKACEHAIEQISSLRERLKNELHAHLPQRLAQRIRYQGILLTPANAQLPLRRLADAERRGLTIFPIRFSHQAQLCDYVCKLNQPDQEHYKHRNAERSSSDFDWIHQLLILGALNGRKQDAFCNERAALHAQRSGVYLNYEHPEPKSKGYAALSLCTQNEAVAFSSDELQNSAKEALSNLGFAFHTNIFRRI